MKCLRHSDWLVHYSTCPYKNFWLVSVLNDFIHIIYLVFTSRVNSKRIFVDKRNIVHTCAKYSLTFNPTTSFAAFSVSRINYLITYFVRYNNHYWLRTRRSWTFFLSVEIRIEIEWQKCVRKYKMFKNSDRLLFSEVLWGRCTSWTLIFDKTFFYGGIFV